MPLLLPGEERTRPRLLEALLAIAVVVGLCSLGCASSLSSSPRASSPPASAPRAARTRRLPAPVIAAARLEAPPAPRAPARKDEGAAFVERSLRDAGLRFGTDGSTRALWAYMRVSHTTVSPAKARAGDLLFFDTRPASRAPDCDDDTDHAGIVEGIEPDGRIVFVEARGGQLRRSVVDPDHPTMRRNDRGEIANSFLRVKRVADPRDARYFAGEMLCGIARVDR